MERGSSSISSLLDGGASYAAGRETFLRTIGGLPRTAELFSYCTGVAFLAAAGRLNGRSATATWWMQGLLTARFPRVRWRFDEPLVHDGKLRTAAGPSGYLALMLAVLEARLDSSSLEDLNRVLMLPRPRMEHACLRPVELITLRDESLRRLAVFVQRTRARDVSLEGAARFLSLSVRTLCRRIKEETGLPAGTWLRLVKVRQASEALTRSDAPVKQISDALGYASEATLHRAFHRATGQTPGQFRLANADPIRTPSRRASI